MWFSLMMNWVGVMLGWLHFWNNVHYIGLFNPLCHPLCSKHLSLRAAETFYSMGLKTKNGADWCCRELMCKHLVYQTWICLGPEFTRLAHLFFIFFFFFTESAGILGWILLDAIFIYLPKWNIKQPAAFHLLTIMLAVFPANYQEFQAPIKGPSCPDG